MDGLSFTNSEQTLITQSHLLNTEHTHARPPTITFCHCRKYNMKSNQKWLEGKEANDWHFRENLVPWGILSAGPSPWCRAPWRNTNRTCLWPETDWQPLATERGSPPARTGESRWTDALNTHFIQWEETEENTTLPPHNACPPWQIRHIGRTTHQSSETGAEHTLYARGDTAQHKNTLVWAQHKTKIFQGSSSILVRLACLQSVSVISVSLMWLNDREI